MAHAELLLACFLFGGSARLNAWCRCLLPRSIKARPKGVHQIDHTRGRSGLGGFDLFTGLFLLQ